MQKNICWEQGMRSKGRRVISLIDEKILVQYCNQIKSLYDAKSQLLSSIQPCADIQGTR